MIKPCFSPQDADWLALRAALWPEAQNHLEQMAKAQSDPDSYGVYLAYSDAGEAVGFVEIGLRHEPIGGIKSAPVGYLEALYVQPESRRQGIARELLAVAEEWAQFAGCEVLVSGVSLDDKQGRERHASLGFEAGEKVVFYCKRVGS